MDHSIKTALGIKDQHLELDLKCQEEPIVDHGSKIIVHLIQTYPLTCPICGKPMLHNGFKLVKCLGPALDYKPTIWLIKKQKYLCKPSPECPQTVTRLAQVQDIQFHNRIARSIKQRVMMRLMNNESQTDIAKNCAVSDWTVRRIIFHFDQFFKPNYHWLPRHIAFDDFNEYRESSDPRYYSITPEQLLT